MKTIEVTDQEFETLYWAIQDSMTKWSMNISNCRLGLNPGMSITGAESIYKDLSVMNTKFKVLSAF